MIPIHLNRKRQSKEKQFIEMLEGNKAQFYRIAYSYMRNEHDALDAVQESVCKAYEHLDDLRECKYMKTWFTRILINTSNDMLSNKKRQRPDAFIEVELEDSQDAVNQTEAKIDLMHSLSQLSEKEKAIILLRYFEDYKLEDVSRAVDLPLSTTKSILYRALKKMRINLEEVNIYE